MKSMDGKLNLRSLWGSADQSDMDALEKDKYLDIHDRRKNPTLEDSDWDSRSTASAFSELYAAIPNEFRPRKVTASFTRTFVNNNRKQRIKGNGKLQRTINRKQYEFNDQVSVRDSDVVINRKQKETTAEKYLAFAEHPAQKNRSNMIYNGGTLSSKLSNVPVNKPYVNCTNSSENNNIKYYCEIANSNNPVKSQFVSRESSNIPEERYKHTNEDNCTKLQNLSIYKKNKQSEIMTVAGSTKYTTAASSGISTLLIDRGSQEDSNTNTGLGVISPSQEKIFNKKQCSDTHVPLPSDNCYKGNKNHNAGLRPSANYKYTKPKRNNLSKVSHASYVSSENLEKTPYNICEEKQNVMSKQIEDEYQKQNFGETENEVKSSYNTESPVLIIKHKCYIKNCHSDQGIEDRNNSESSRPDIDSHRRSDYAKSENAFPNKQYSTKNRSFSRENNEHNMNYRRNRPKWEKSRHENSFHNLQTKVWKPNVRLPIVSSATRKQGENANDSKNKVLTSSSFYLRNVKSFDISYSVHSSDCPSTSSSSSSDGNGDDEQPIQYRIVSTDYNEFDPKLFQKSINDYSQTKSSNNNGKVEYREKIVRWRGNFSRKCQSNIGTKHRNQEINETKMYKEDELLHEVMHVNYEKIKSDAQERYNTISSNRSEQKYRTKSDDNPKKCPTNLQSNNDKYAPQDVKWSSHIDLSHTERCSRNSPPEEPFPEAVENSSRIKLMNSDKLNSDAETEDKKECAKDIAGTCALKTEVPEKQIHELSSDAKERLIADSELSTKRKVLMDYGRKISDFILGNYFAVEELLSLYLEWSKKREDTMHLCVTLAKNLVDLKNVPGQENEILKQVKLGASLISVLPLPYCSIIGNLISVVTKMVSTIMSPSSPKLSDLDEVGITLSLQQDLEVSSELYRQCLICDQQFQNTCELIEKFYLTIANDNYECLFETSRFLQEIMELKPGSSTYYKRLRKAIEKTIQKDLKSELEISFCQLFVEYSSALSIVDKLDWRFRAEGFNLDSLENRWQELSIALLSYDSVTLDDITSKIQNCVRIFSGEELAVKRTISRFH